MPKVFTDRVPKEINSNTYTVLEGDHGRMLAFTNTASAVAVALPQAGDDFPEGWSAWFKAAGNQVVTVTPTTSTVDGAGSFDLAAGDSRLLASDGTNYKTVAAASSAASSFTDLDDVPSNYTDDAGKYVRVNSGETALEFTNEVNEKTTATATYYVDSTSGSDSNAGTSGSPKATIMGVINALPVTIANNITIKVREASGYAEAVELSRLNILAQLFIYAVNDSDEDAFYSGTATGGSSTTLVDSGASWATDQFAGAYCWISDGNGQGGIAQIASNTSTTLTLTSWPTIPYGNPASGSVYSVGGLVVNAAGSSAAFTIADKRVVTIRGFTISSTNAGGAVVFSQGSFGTVEDSRFVSGNRFLGVNACLQVTARGCYIAPSGGSIGLQITNNSIGVIRNNVFNGSGTSSATGYQINSESMASLGASQPNRVINWNLGIQLINGSGANVLATGNSFSGNTSNTSVSSDSWNT